MTAADFSRQTREAQMLVAKAELIEKWLRESNRDHNADFVADMAQALDALAARVDALQEALRHMAESAELTHCQNDPQAPCAEHRDELEWPDDWCWRCWVKEIADAAVLASAVPAEGENA